MNSHRGYTLIEVLVTVFIIGILAALTLAGVQAAREAAQSAQCGANLRQIAMAMNAYMARDSVLPSAMCKYNNVNFPHCVSPFVGILPDLEQTTTYNTMNMLVVQGPEGIPAENRTAASVTINLFLCPSDGGPTPVGTGPMNYRANMGAGYQSFPKFMAPGEPGPFELAAWVSPAQISDGLLTTALVSERLRGDRDPTGWDRMRDSWFANLSFRRESTDMAITQCSELPAGIPPHYSNGGYTWMIFSYDNTFYNHATTPNGVLPDCGSADTATGSYGASDSGIYAARGWHSSVVNVATADGAVHRVGSGIALPVWRALGTRAGGEVNVHSAF